MQHICTPLDVNLISSVCFLWIICPKKTHRKKTWNRHQVTMSGSWCSWTRKGGNRDSEFIKHSREGGSRENFVNLWPLLYIFHDVSGTVKVLLAQLSPQKDRLIISESSLSWNSVWGKTVLFCYFHIILYLILVHVWSCECTSCQMQWSDKSYMFVNIQKIGEKKNKTLHKFYTPGVQRPLDLN